MPHCWKLHVTSHFKVIPVFEALKRVIFGDDPSGRNEACGMSVGGACVTQGAVPLPVGAGARAAMDILPLMH